MSGARQIGRSRLRIDRHPNGPRTVISGDAGRDSLTGIDRLTERRPIIRSILGAHGSDSQMVQPLFGERQANESPAILSHEVDSFRSDFFRRQRQVALVFAIFVIHNDHHPAGTKLLHCGGYVRKPQISAHRGKL